MQTFLPLFSFSEKVQANRQAGNYPSFPSAPGPLHIGDHPPSIDASPPCTITGREGVPEDHVSHEPRRKKKHQLWRRITKAFQGAVYDLRHLDALPGNTKLHRVACALTRQNRWMYFLLVILVIILAFTIGFGVARSCKSARPKSVMAAGGTMFPMIGAKPSSSSLLSGGGKVSFSDMVIV